LRLPGPVQNSDAEGELVRAEVICERAGVGGGVGERGACGHQAGVAGGGGGGEAVVVGAERRARLGPCDGWGWRAGKGHGESEAVAGLDGELLVAGVEAEAFGRGFWKR